MDNSFIINNRPSSTDANKDQPARSGDQLGDRKSNS